VVAGRLTLDGWDDRVEQWIARLNSLARWCPEFGLAPIGEDERRHLIQQICHGAFAGRDLRDRDAGGVVRSWISGAGRELLDAHAPERVTLANGKQPRVTYSVEHPPWIALAIQELYGVGQTPRIALGRVPVVVRILAPNRRPVQTTEDLAGFWREQYPRVKQELQRRYPKHEWR
jgi:ATP-dependent helicase HrpB